MQYCMKMLLSYSFIHSFIHRSNPFSSIPHFEKIHPKGIEPAHSSISSAHANYYTNHGNSECKMEVEIRNDSKVPFLLSLIKHCISS